MGPVTRRRADVPLDTRSGTMLASAPPGSDGVLRSWSMHLLSRMRLAGLGLGGCVGARLPDPPAALPARMGGDSGAGLADGRTESVLLECECAEKGSISSDSLRARMLTLGTPPTSW